MATIRLLDEAGNHLLAENGDFLVDEASIAPQTVTPTILEAVVTSLVPRVLADPIRITPPILTATVSSLALTLFSPVTLTPDLLSVIVTPRQPIVLKHGPGATTPKRARRGRGLDESPRREQILRELDWYLQLGLL